MHISNGQENLPINFCCLGNLAWAHILVTYVKEKFFVVLKDEASKQEMPKPKRMNEENPRQSCIWRKVVFFSWAAVNVNGIGCRGVRWCTPLILALGAWGRGKACSCLQLWCRNRTWERTQRLGIGAWVQDSSPCFHNVGLPVELCAQSCLEAECSGNRPVLH